MPLNEKQKRGAVAIVKKLKQQKGMTFNQAEINGDITKIKKAQQEILKLKENYKEVPVVLEEADKEYRKLQDIVDGLNEYMSILHPEGLLDFGTGKGGKQVVSQG